MPIPVLPSLCGRDAWLDFCRREPPYAYVRSPQALVDLQAGFLIITCLDDSIRDGRQAIKYSIGSRYSAEPAWRFIRACHFDLAFMMDGLARTDFDTNARDNSLFGEAADVTIRKFYNKERSIIAPATVGPLTPLTSLPARPGLLDGCRVLANGQYRDLETVPPRIGAREPAESLAEALLDELILRPAGWHLTPEEGCWTFCQHGKPRYRLIPHIEPASVRRPPIR